MTPWELRPWELLTDRFDVSYLTTGRNRFDPGRLHLAPVPARTRRDRLPEGRMGDLVAAVAGDDYRDLEELLADADVVHAAELSYWFAAAAARARAAPGAGFALVQTVWETLPLLDAYRNRPARRYRRQVLDATDLFLPATERARQGLRLEGVPDDRILVCPPGIDTERFGAGPSRPPAEHVVLSPGRLVWEKGHQDVIRALAALRDGLAGEPMVPPRLEIVGRGAEEDRLLAHARELGVADRVSIRALSYDEMPAAYARASCMVLASLPLAGAPLHPFDVPRVFWEEQFGLVLAEAMAAGLDILASTSGAIPEVAGDSATYFAPGDWLGLARALAAGPLTRPPGERVAHPRERVERHSLPVAARSLTAAYERALAMAPRV